MMPLALVDSGGERAPAPGSGAFRRTDAGNGEYFARLYGDRVRYDHRRGRWLVWADHWWRDDDTRAVRRLAKEAARARYGSATAISSLRERNEEARFAIGSENRQRIDAMLLAAQSEPPIADPGDRWDADPYLLGVANGVVDLRTGILRPGAPDDRITLHTGVPFMPGASCPRWERFLEEVFAGDDELIAYVARAVGYSLTGDTSEQCLFTCYGTGSNGKSVLLSMIRTIAGSCAANTPFSTFELRSRASIPNDLAALAGKRLVTASETAEDTRLNESRLKAITGGDPITARFLHGEFFTYRPVAKFWLAVNHKPRVVDDSYAFWRRMQLVPFVRQFSSDADPHLADKLLAESAGILGWAVRGALEWQRGGLRPPVTVTAATETYRAESDPLGEFMERECVVGERYLTGASEAYRAYRAWAAEAGLGDRETLTATQFGTRMRTRFGGAHRKNGNVYTGVGLLSARPDPPGGGSVKGPVKGFEREIPESDVPPPMDQVTRGNLEEGFTALHPSPRGNPIGGPEECIMEGAEADCMWTDPPYGVGYVGKTRRALTIENDEAEQGPAVFASACRLASLAPCARFYAAVPAGPLQADFLLAIREVGWRLHQELVWVKSGIVLGHSDYHYAHEPILYGYAPGPGRPGRGAHEGSRWYGDNSASSVLAYDRPSRNERHPTMKPVGLIEECLANSTRSGDLVYEPFAGSGSTLIAAETLGRCCYAIEIDPAYAQVSLERWAAFTGLEPVRG